MNEIVEKAQPFGTFGGSHHYAKRLVPLIPKHGIYVEPFAGAAALLYVKEPSDKEVIADTDPDVVFLHRSVKSMTEEKLKRLRRFNWTCTEASWKRVRDMTPRDDMERFYKLAFIRGKGRDARPDATHAAGAAMGQTTNPEKYLRAAERLKNISILHQDYRKTVEQLDGPDSFFFLDPPYPGEWFDKDASINIKEFVDTLRGIKGRFIAVLNDSPENTAAFKTVGKVFRLKVHEASGIGGGKKASRLFCANYKLSVTKDVLYAPPPYSLEPEALHFTSDWTPEILKAIPERGGVQVWDPDKKQIDADRTELRPLAFFQPMKPAPRPTNEFRKLDDVFLHFATAGALATGIGIGPKWNGYRIEIQKAGDRMLMFTEDKWRDVSGNFPSVVKELKAIKGDFALDTELIAFEDDKPLPRRELARFRGKEPVDDSGVRLMVFHALWLPDIGNLTATHYDEMREKLSAWFKGKKLTHLVISPFRVVRTEKALRDAVDWATKQPASEGAMLKSVTSTYSLGGQSSSWSKLKMSREVTAIIYDRDPVKGSPGVYNFSCAVGPIKDPDEWKETAEVGGKHYTVIGKTGNAKLAADKGDRIVAEVFELLYDESGDKKRIHWFGPPMVVEKTDARAMTADEVIGLVHAWEIEKQLDSEQNLNVNFIRESVEKAKEDERYVLGIVLEPEEKDAQGDIYSADEIKKAAWTYMAKWRNRGYMHQIPINDDVDLVESIYVHPEMELKVGGKKIKTGTWLLGFHMHGDAYWTDVKAGKITGLSIGGTANRAQEKS